MASPSRRIEPGRSAETVSPGRFLTALPVYNEARHVEHVLTEVALHASDILVVDDGSTDGTADLLAGRSDLCVERHPENRGYGAALQTAFDFAVRQGYDVLVTIDCDGQHEPQRIGRLAAACVPGIDIVSGSRYRVPEVGAPEVGPEVGAEVASIGEVPRDRRRINAQITEELNCRFGLQLTDAFCGFKAYRTSCLTRLRLTESGYAMPLELWVQAAHLGLVIRELAVPRIYLEEERSFGGALDDAERRLRHYHEVIDRAAAVVGRTVQERLPHPSQRCR